jgi:hypothetical protein
MQYFMKLIPSLNVWVKIVLFFVHFYFMTSNVIAASWNNHPVCNAIPCYLAGGVSYRLNMDKKEMTVYNPSWYTGVFIQYNESQDIMAVDFIGGTKTSWFAKKYTDPTQWINTAGNFAKQTKALFSDFKELGRLQSHITKVNIAQDTHDGVFVIGGVASLIFDVGAILIDIPVNDYNITQKIKESIVEAYNNQTRWTNIQTYIVDGEIIKASNETLNMIFLLLEKKLTPEMFKFFLKKLVKHGIISPDVLDDAIKKINIISNALEGVQMVANGIDGVLFNYYHAGKKPLQTNTVYLASDLSCIFYQQQNSLLYEFPFKDVCVTNWYASYVLKGEQSGLIKGYPDDTFRPNYRVSRAEWLAMVVRLMEKRQGSFLPIDNVPFIPSQSLKQAWYYKDQHILQKAYYNNQKNDESLAFWKDSEISTVDFWDTPITREEVVQVLAKVLQISTEQTTQKIMIIVNPLPITPYPRLYEDNFVTRDIIFPANRTILITEEGNSAYISYPAISTGNNLVSYLSNPTIEYKPKLPFSDVPFNSPEADLVYPIINLGIMKGYQNNEFGLKNNLTRGQAVKILVILGTL